jgi:hypothetical protein
LATLAVAASCTDLPPIEPGVCGNRVLDADEDCDTFSEFGEGTSCGAPASAQACTYVCSAEAACPAGWGCGQDGRCRRPSGAHTAAPGSPWRFKVQDFAIGDVDGDGNADLVGDGQSRIAVRFGTPTGEFPVDLDVTTRRPVGPVQFTRFDDDALLDVVMPIESGLFVMLGQPERALLPVSYAPFDLPQEISIRLVPVDGDPDGFGSEILGFFGTEMSFMNTLGAATMPHDVSDLVGRVPVTDLGDDGPHELALAFAGEDRVWVFTTTGSGPTLRPIASQVVLLPPTTGIQSGAMFADVNGDGAEDLLVSVGNDEGQGVAIAYNDGAGLLDGFAPIDPLLSGWGVWPLAAADFGGDAKADYVSAYGVLMTDLDVAPSIGPPQTLTPTVYLATDAWVEAAAGDFNGDGVLDFAAAVEGTDGVGFYLGEGSGLFNKFHVDTEAPPIALRTGDYDGDFVHDLAFGMTSGLTAPNTLAVCFGAATGGPSEPISMGDFGFIQQVEPLVTVADLESLDAITDLMVISRGFSDPDSRHVAVLIGSSERRLLSPFALQVISEIGPQFDVPSRALVGHFMGEGDPATDPRDIVALAQPQRALPDEPVEKGGEGGGGEPGAEPGVEASRVWLVPGEGSSGGLSASETLRVPLPEELEASAFCTRWTAGDLDGDGWDEVITIDNTVDCWGFGGTPAPRLGVMSPGVAGDRMLSTVELPGDLRAPRELSLWDLDGDFDLDLVILFAGELYAFVPGGDAPALPEGAGIAVVWNDGGALATGTMSTITIPGTAGLFDVAAIHLDADAVPEVAVLASGAVYAVWRTETGYGEPVALLPQNGEGQLAVGDVNGDGVQDIAWTEGAEVQVFLGVEGAPLGSDGVTVSGVEPEPGEMP